MRGRREAIAPVMLGSPKGPTASEQAMSTASFMVGSGAPAIARLAGQLRSVPNRHDPNDLSFRAIEEAVRGKHQFAVG